MAGYVFTPEERRGWSEEGGDDRAYNGAEDRYLDTYMEDRMGGYYEGEDALDPYAYGPDEDEDEDTPESATGTRWVCQTCYEIAEPDLYLPDDFDSGSCADCDDGPVLIYSVEA